MGVRRLIYEWFLSVWKFRGRSRLMTLLDRTLGIQPYGTRKPKQVGSSTLYLDPGDPNDRVYFFGMQAKGVAEVIRHVTGPGDHVIDVGGNVGFITAVARDVVGSEGRVDIVEASPSAVERLNASFGSASNVTIHHAAITAESVESIPFYEATVSGWSSLIENETFEANATVHVPALTLDDLIRSLPRNHVRVLKLDIEGGEFDALVGGRESLGAGLIDVLVIELETHRLRSFGRTKEDVSTLMAGLGYAEVATIKDHSVHPPRRDSELDGADMTDVVYARAVCTTEVARLLSGGR